MEADIAVLVEKRFGIQLIRWPSQPGQTGQDWVDINSGVTYDAIKLEVGYFDSEWSLGNIQRTIIKHVGKADVVPVYCVPGMRPDQIAKVQEYIKPLGSNVFILGG
jgi:hypothetical protein